MSWGRSDQRRTGEAAPVTRVDPGRVLVRTEGVGVVFEGRQVLSGVDLEVRQREILALTGPNGGGKTTLLRILLGLLRPHAGSVTWFDEHGRAHSSPQRPTGYVAQRPAIDPRFPLTVRRVVEMPLRGGRLLSGKISREKAGHALEALERLGISHLSDRLAGRLSGGQTQRMLIARAIVTHPSLLLLDEPETGVDERGREELLELLAEIRIREGTAIILSTHEPAHVSALADRVLTVDGGVS